MEALELSTSSYSQSTNQQDRELTGNATDQEGLPVLGVSVMVKGTTIGTITDLDGNYRLTISENAEIVVFSFVGTKTQEIPIGNRDVIDIVMEHEAIGITEVVANGYGYQTKREVSGSITNVTNEEFNKGIMNSAADLLKGKVAGLQMTQTGDDVTNSSTIRLRGTTPLSASSEPLIVIDGIPGLSLDIAPENIESISVLKDASASAIYGSRGANGVIMITTRRGKASETQIEYSTFVAIETPAKLPRFLTATENRDYIQEAGITHFDNAGGDTDWWDEISRNGVSQQHNVTLSGGGEKHNYIGTVNYQDRQGEILSNEMKKLDARFSFSQRALYDRLKVTLTGMSNQRDWTPIDYWAFLIAKNMRPTEPVYNDDSSYYKPFDYDIGNPVSMLMLNPHDREMNNTLINGMFELDLIKGLTYNLNLTRSNEKEVGGEYFNSTTRSEAEDNGLATRDAQQSALNVLETNLTYVGNWNNHKLTLLGGYSFEESVWDDFSVRNRECITNSFLYNVGNRLLAIHMIRNCTLLMEDMWNVKTFLANLNTSKKFMS